MIDTAKYKTILEEEKAKIEQELGDLGKMIDPESGDWIAVPPEVSNDSRADLNDNADAIEEFGERVAALNVLEGRYVQIREALDKIEKADGSYGMCTTDGDTHPIEEDRLGANPAATTCKAHME